MIKINLLPVRAERRKEFIRKQLSIVALSIVCALAVMAFFFFRLQNHYNSTNSSLHRTNKEIKRLEPVIRKINAYKIQKDDISRKISIIIDLDRYRLAPVVVLSDLNQLRPEKLWFNSIKTKGKRLTISGVAVDNETIVTFLNSLKESVPLKEANLTLLRSRNIKALKLKAFTIDCHLDLDSLPAMLKELKAPPAKLPGENQHG